MVLWKALPGENPLWPITSVFVLTPICVLEFYNKGIDERLGWLEILAAILFWKARAPDEHYGRNLRLW